MRIIRMNYYFQKESESFKAIYNERLDKLGELSKKNDYINLKCTVISTDEIFEFDKSEEPITLLDHIKTD